MVKLAKKSPSKNNIMSAWECSQLTGSSSGSGTEGNGGGSLSGGKSNASLEGLEPALPFCGSAGHEGGGGSTGGIVCVF